MGQRHKRIRWDRESEAIRNYLRRKRRREVKRLIQRGRSEMIPRDRGTQGWYTY